MKRRLLLPALILLTSAVVKAQCPAPGYANNPSSCTNTTVTLAVTSYNSPSVTQHRWYTTQYGGSSITPTVQFSPASGVWTSQLVGSFSSMVTYWVSAVCNGTESTSRKSVTYTPAIPGSLSISTGGTPPFLCSGNSITLTPQGGSGYSWSSSPSGASGSGQITVSPTVTTTYYLTGPESVCGTIKSTYLIVGVAPKVGPVTLTGEQTVCPGSSTQYSASATNASYYQWSVTPVSAGTILNGQATWSSSFSGTATVQVTAFSPSGCSYTTSNSTSVEVKGSPTAIAGVDQTGTATCGQTSVTLGATAPASGTGLWSIVSGAGGNIANPSNPTSEFSGTAGSTYTLRWTNSNPPCASSTDDVAIKFNRYPSEADAGPDKTVYRKTTVNLAASAPAIGSGLWSVVAGTGGSFANAANPTTIFTGALGSQYTLRWTTTNDACAREDDVIIELSTAQNANYVRTITFQKEGLPGPEGGLFDPKEYSESTTYFDGLGRPIQSVVRMASPERHDVVQPVVYDAFGRQFRKYLPFVPDENSGALKDPMSIIGPSGDYAGSAEMFYDDPESTVADDDGDHPFAETVFEASPLNRIVEQGAPGSPWQPGSGNTIRMSYQTNAADEVLLWRYSPPDDDHPLGLVFPTDVSAPNTPVHYDENQLYKNVTKDEQDHDVIEYKDKEGKVVLKRVQAVETPAQTGDEDYASTYYIYDDFGQLVCVLPPEAVSRLGDEYYQMGSDDNTKEGFLERWAFRYRYDSRKRMIMKQVPGVDSVSMIYDERDRLVLTQDGRQRIANQWLFTKYDELNRPVVTGIYTHGSRIDRREMMDELSTGTISEVYNGNVSNYGYSNSVFPAANCEVLTVTYYDNYDFKTLINDPDDYFDYKDDEITVNGGLKAQDADPFGRVKALVTGSQTRILNSANFLWNVNYYDDHYRLIQATASNNKGGVNRLTSVYDFTGKVMQTQTRYIIPGHPEHPDVKVYQRFSYDHAGRLLKTWHRIGSNPEVVISSNEYNELGQLVTKKLHQTSVDGTLVTADPLADAPGTAYGTDIVSDEYSSNASTYVASNSIRLLPGFTVPLNSTFTAKIGYSAEAAQAYNDAIEGEYLQVIDYRYNIRGWLKTINDPSDPVDLFNMELRYNTPTANGGNPQFNGNISEAIWKSAGLDKQSYGYDYDPMNRILKGSYYNLANPARDGNYDEQIGDPENLSQVPAYDLNGNIQNLFRNGKIEAGTYGLMDDLHYDYGADGGNQLMFVSDAQAITTSEEGFKEAVEGTTDYSYDKNGNLTKDENKGITEDLDNGFDGIEYNHLNLPWRVSKSSTEYLIYTYDATGRKLSQRVFGTQPKMTEYVGELVFEDNVLQFILHPEGRVVKDTEDGAPDSWEYQYHLKDHLGNVRLTFTTREETTEETATLEPANEETENMQFLRYENARTVQSHLVDRSMGEAPTTTPGYAQRLSGGLNERYGLAKSISVMPGDKITAEVYAKYIDPVSDNWSTALQALMAQVAAGANGTTVIDGNSYSGSTSSFPFAYEANQNTASSSEAGPKAYLNWLVFDRDYNFNLSKSGYDRLSATPKEYGQDVSHEPLFSPEIVIDEPGYVYIYLSNEEGTPLEVYFDDFRVEHTKSPVVQMEDYYPFGLTFNSYQRENSLDQRYLYNSKELQDELSLSWFDYGARMYMSDIGRWGVIDPLSEVSRRWNPYNYAFNNPMRFIDPDGMLTYDWVRGMYVDENGEQVNQIDAMQQIHSFGETVHVLSGNGDPREVNEGQDSDFARGQAQQEFDNLFKAFRGTYYGSAISAIEAMTNPFTGENWTFEWSIVYGEGDAQVNSDKLGATAANYSTNQIFVRIHVNAFRGAPKDGRLLALVLGHEMVHARDIGLWNEFRWQMDYPDRYEAIMEYHAWEWTLQAEQNPRINTSYGAGAQYWLDLLGAQLPAEFDFNSYSR